MLPAIYKNLCPRCGQDISSENLNKGLFCEKCLKELKQNTTQCKNLGNFLHFGIAEEKVKNFNMFFKQKTGNELNPLQKMWAKRFFLDNSFALLAPTGIGKTTFGLLLAGFVKNAYIIFPTKLLVLQAIEQFKQRGIDVLAYTGKKEEKEKIKNNNYEILITTTQFLYKNQGLIKKDFKLVFVDDVDSILKSGKKITSILKLLGFSETDLQKALEYINSKEYEKLEKIKNKKKGNLIVSSATANPKSKRILLFKYLLGFEVSKPNLSLRNIEDTFNKNFSYENSIKWIKTLGEGGLLFLPGNKTKQHLYEYINFLNSHNIKAYSYEEFEDHLEEFKQGQCYFVGFASYRNPLARGINLPEYVKYALFVGVPKLEFNLNTENYKNIYFIALSLLPFFSKKLEFKEFLKLQKDIKYLKKYVFLPQLSENIENKIKSIVANIKNLIKNYIEEIKKLPEISFDGEKIITADITGYIQASGRTSRFLNGHLTKGLALVLIDNEKAFYSLQKKLKWFTQAEFKNINQLNIEKILKEINQSRQSKEKIKIKTTFIVVESPTKAKTISNFFGKPTKRIINNTIVYEILLKDRLILITASIGHDFDLVENEGIWGVINYYIPIFEIIQNKENIIKAQNIVSFEVDEILIATDPDQEGEKIAFDLTLTNKPYNLNIKRIEFHEITKFAFNQALENPRDINLNLVSSQFLRRIADRWIGFKISSFIQNQFHNQHLSAGRVQTPVLNWICERTNQLKEKIYKVILNFENITIDFTFENKTEAENFLNQIPKKINIQKVKEEKESLYEKPFITSELLKEASNKLHFSPQKTMKLAQELFENGLITYHRTDSHKISQLGLKIAKDYIKEKFGENYIKLREFNETGAHEAIRPTTTMDKENLQAYIISQDLNLNYEHIKLYDLIFRKFIASQMKETIVLKETFKILNTEKTFITKILEDGFNLIYPIKITSIEEGEKQVTKQLEIVPKYLPYTYADIIQLMKEKGIGRPSTYAITIEKLLERKYITDKKGFLFATRLGFAVNKVINNCPYKEFVSEEFTAELEKKMDLVQEQKEDYKQILKNLAKLLNL